MITIINGSAGQDEEDVRQERERAIDEAAEVRGGNADRERDHGCGNAAYERDGERRSRAPDHLREDVLAVCRGAEGMVPGNGLIRGGGGGPGITRRQPRSEDGHRDEQSEERAAEARLAGREHAADSACGAQGGVSPIWKLPGGHGQRASRERGSMIKLAMSASTAATSTATVIRKKIACMSGRSWPVTAWYRR